jgi:hypothetical protein
MSRIRLLLLPGKAGEEAAELSPPPNLLSLTQALADNNFVFNNSQYIAKYQSGDVAKIPKIIGTTAREASALVAYPLHNYTAGPSMQEVVAATLSTFCASYNTSVLREAAGLQTYRYQWAGNFSNIDGGVLWLGAYHYSDLYMFFGSYPIAPGPIPNLEVQTSLEMQYSLYDFIADPGSLPAKGWPLYNASSSTGGTLARFGADGKVLQLVDGNDVEGACHLSGYTYDTTPWVSCRVDRVSISCAVMISKFMRS